MESGVLTFTTVETKTWDEEFFNQFCKFKNDLYSKVEDAITEELKDLKPVFGGTSQFSRKTNWVAVLVKQGDQLIGRYALFYLPEKADPKVHFGYFECLSECMARPEYAIEFKKSFDRSVALIQREFPSKNKILGPIQGSIFYGYRFREESNAKRFFGESVNLPHLPLLLEKWGFSRSGCWDSYSFSFSEGASHFQKIKNRLRHLWTDSSIQCRLIDFKKYDQEIQSIHAITRNGYGLESTLDDISLEEFRELADKMKPVLKKEYVHFLEWAGKPVAFTMIYPDIQPLIRWYRRCQGMMPKTLLKGVLYFRIKYGRHPLILQYIVKTKNCQIPWAMPLLAEHVSKALDLQAEHRVYSAFNARSSGSRASLPAQKKFHSRHFLMEKTTS